MPLMYVIMWLSIVKDIRALYRKIPITLNFIICIKVFLKK